MFHPEASQCELVQLLSFRQATSLLQLNGISVGSDNYLCQREDCLHQLTFMP